MKKAKSKQTILDTVNSDAPVKEKSAVKPKKKPLKEMDFGDGKKVTPKKVKKTKETVAKKESIKSETLLKTIDEPMQESPNMFKTLLIAVVIVFAGTMTGFGLSQVSSSGSGPVGSKDVNTGVETGTGQIQAETLAVGDVVGSDDLENFPDTAEGVLEAGGIEGEGSHKLLRPGGVTQNVYLTSSIVDLDQLVGHRLKVQGDTFAAQKAGWLMDVGQVEILELDAPRPFEEDEE